MQTFDRDSILLSIQNGATVSDLAAAHNCSYAQAAQELIRLQIQLPNARSQTTADQMVAQYLRLIEDGSQHPSHDELLRSPDGAVLGLPPSFSLQRIELNPIFEHFHGKDGYIDPYNGATTQGKVMAVNPSETKPDQPRNFLITNIEAISGQTVAERFCMWMRPIRETFEFAVSEQLAIQLTIQRPYDKLVGGTLSQLFVEHLFERWVGGPLAQHLAVSPENDPVFPSMTPFETAWWAWQQLTHFGLLKGLVELRVTKYPDLRAAVLRDDDIMNAMLGFMLKEAGAASSLVLTNQMPQTRKFGPGALLSR